MLTSGIKLNWHNCYGQVKFAKSCAKIAILEANTRNTFIFFPYFETITINGLNMLPVIHIAELCIIAKHTTDTGIYHIYIAQYYKAIYTAIRLNFVGLLHFDDR